MGGALRWYSGQYGANQMFLYQDGTLTVASGVLSNGMAVNQGGNGFSGGISLYSTMSLVDTYGIAMRQTAWGGTHGGVTADWATYFMI